MTTRELVWNAMFAADMSHRYFLSRAAWNKRADDAVRVLLLVMSSAAWAALVARMPAAAPYLAFAAVILASLTVIVRFHDQAATYATAAEEFSRILNRTNACLEHEIERAGFCQRGGATKRTFAILDVIRSRALFAISAIYQRIGKGLFVT